MTTASIISSSSPVPATRSVPLVGDEPAMREWAEAFVAQARTEGVELTGDNGLLTTLVRQVLQTGLQVELSDHLGYEPHAVAGRGSGNSRNGTYPKTVTTEIGKVTVEVPRDRNGTFEPVTVPRDCPTGWAPARGLIEDDARAARGGWWPTRHPPPSAG
jgi:hypothetical protein